MAKILKIPEAQPETDEMLVDAFQKTGNQDILARLFLKYSDLLYGVCLKYLGDPENARDAVMNIYQELLRKLPLHPVENFKSWAYVLSKNYCLMQLRASKKRMTIPLDNYNVQSDDFSHLDSILEKEQTFKKLEKCMETLIGEQKTSIEMFYYGNKCYNEIVEATGMDWNRVRSNIQNGRRNLKNCMEKHGN